MHKNTIKLTGKITGHSTSHSTSHSTGKATITIVLALLCAVLLGFVSLDSSKKNQQTVRTAALDENSSTLKTPVRTKIASTRTSEDLSPSPTHRKITRNVIKKTLRDHYAQKELDDELSAVSFDRFIDMLDGNKHYFLDADITEFSQYRDKYLTALRVGKPRIAFDIFKRYQTRARDRLQFSLDQLHEEPALDSKERYDFDRDELGWAKSKTEWDTIWQQRITNDIINQFLAGKDWEKTRKTLHTRYTTALRQIDQQQADDVFQLFLNAYIDSLDPHSGYFSPKNEDERNIQSSLTYTGIGASLSMQDEYVTVANIIPGGPAQITELVQVDDHIIGVGQDGEDIQEVFGWRLDDVVELIRGPKNTKVSLRLIRDVVGSGENEIEIELVRNQITLEAQAAKKDIIDIQRDGQALKMGVITIPSFYQDYRGKWAGNPNYKSTTKDVYKLLKELEAENTRGVIIDLRNNGGGNLEEAITLTGLFIDEGPVVQFRSARNRTQVYEDSNTLTDIAYTGPLTVLVNRYSASASEIFAAALQDYERALIVGQTTFGKGTVQEQIPLDNKLFKSDERYGLLSLTIGKFYRINGGSTQHRGVIPDIILPSYIDTKTVGESTEDSALAWDQINKSYYQVSGDISPELIAQLNQAQALRAKKDPDMIYLQNDIASINALRARTSFSLSLEERRQERNFHEQQRLQRENERRKAQGLKTLTDFDALEDDEALDIQLDQTTELMADLLSLGTSAHSKVATRKAKADIESPHVASPQ